MPSKLKYQPKPGRMTPNFAVGQEIMPRDAAHEESLLASGNFVKVRTSKPKPKPEPEPQPSAVENEGE